MSTKMLRLTGSEHDVSGFLRGIEGDIEDISVSDPATYRADGDRLGHVDLVEVVIKIGESVAARGAIEAIKRAYEASRHRRRLDLEEVVGPQGRPDPE